MIGIPDEKVFEIGREGKAIKVIYCTEQDAINAEFKMMREVSRLLDGIF